MNPSRREFLKNSGVVVAGATIFSRQLLTAGNQTEMLGIQLYSVRDDMGTDPSGTLQKLAAIGYVFVEHANYHARKFYGYSAAEFKKLLDGLGMKMHSGHTGLRIEHWDDSKKDFTDEWKQTVEDAAIAGQRYVISPALDEKLRKDRDGTLKFMEVFNKSGELCKKSGMKFGYHNHDFEFNTMFGSKRMYEIIMENTDPSLVVQQLDIGNLFNGGAKAIDVVKQYPGRFTLMHVKDEIKSADQPDHYESTLLGQGIVNTKEVIDIGRQEGTSYFIVEQESYQGKPAIDCAREDFKIMKSWGY